MLKWAVIFALALGCHGQLIVITTPSTTPTISTDSTTTESSSTTSTESTSTTTTTETTTSTTTTEATTSAPTINEMCRYYLYTRNNPQTPDTVLADETNLQASAISIARKTVILVHGHGGSAFTSLNPGVRNALLTVEDVNIISVDWSNYASLTYSTALVMVPSVAESLANFITRMVNAGVASLNNIHIVGFNLGAHVAGIAGRSLNRIARITGLDPSTSSTRLSLIDASYVEVIHTDGGAAGNGIGEAIGDVDFFANGGIHQPGCGSHACCHDRAHELFAASMVNPDLIGYPCSTHLQMTINLCNGLPLRLGTNDLIKIGSGIYRINTKIVFPF